MNLNNLKKLASVLSAACGLALTSLSAHASFIPLGRTNYFQNFDTLVSAGKSATVPNGWAIQEYGNADGKLQADDGTMTAGGMYSYGKNGSGNRAIGSLGYRAGGNADYAVFGANFQNTSGGSINSLRISYTGEEWRLGATGRGQDRLQFQYSLNAGSLSSGTWLNAPSLDFLTPNVTGVGAHDGTLAANEKQIAGTLSFQNIPVGSTFWVRWVDVALPGGGPEDGLAIDNFSITAVPEVSTWFAALMATGLLGVVLWRRGSPARSLSLA